LDSSALIALLDQEPGADKVEALMPDAVMSTVNFAEVVAKFSNDGLPGTLIQAEMRAFRLETVPFNREMAIETGLLRRATRRLGLSLGDRACLALARSLGVPAITADGLWKETDLGVEITLIR
jgi:PIN domain nuclease of toxin-antitoxin system